MVDESMGRGPFCCEPRDHPPDLQDLDNCIQGTGTITQTAGKEDVHYQPICAIQPRRGVNENVRKRES